jgi:hypothetical protein
MSQKGRVTLTEYFEAGKIPTEGNFADLIDSSLNKTDDQIFVKPVSENEKNGRNIGIGTTDPQSPLSIRNRIENEKLLGFENTGGEEEWNIAINPAGKNGLNIQENKNANSNLFIQSGGNVGIGTISPQATLDLNGTIKISDGSQGRGKILTSDSDGLASWQQPVVVMNVPLGSITAWHKSFAGIVLPDGWVECNGQKLNDSNSPFHNQMIPDLNNAGRFLRGAVISGTMQADAFQGHNVQSTLQVYAAQYGAGGTLYDTQMAWNQSTLTSTIVSDEVNGIPRIASETRPINMSVVWIMRIK